MVFKYGMTGISIRVKEACCIYKFAIPGPSFFMYCVGTVGHCMYFAVMKKQKLKPSNRKQMDIHRQSHLYIEYLKLEGTHKDPRVQCFIFQLQLSSSEVLNSSGEILNIFQQKPIFKKT